MESQSNISTLSKLSLYLKSIYSFKLILLDISLFNKFCLSFSAIDHGKVLLFNASSRKNHGYPAKISSEHSPEIATVAFSFMLLQNNNKEDSTEPLINQDENNSNQNKEEKIPTCDGTTITNDCEVDGIIYSIYKYYPAEEEKYHFETITTNERQITGYCTLCNDGTYSPTCATGRGACSHHGGVKKWNAPVYNEVPKTEEKKIIDSPALPERWEKVVKED